MKLDRVVELAELAAAYYANRKNLAARGLVI